MIDGLSPVSQAFLGTLFTWCLTGAGAALVFVFSSQQPKVLDGSLGFAAGVMIAASYWSLLKPAIEIATEAETYGIEGEYVFFPVAFGFLLGALFVFLADIYFPCSEKSVPKVSIVADIQPKLKQNGVRIRPDKDAAENDLNISVSGDRHFINSLRQRNRVIENVENADGQAGEVPNSLSHDAFQMRWKRVMLLIIAITVHNIPEGLAVGVGFAAVNKTTSATFKSARNLALGIGIQNFPEGLAVSLPLHAAGMSKWKSFWYGQLSGLVEPLAGLLGCFAVTLAEPLLPYALSFAAGAMIYVVVDDIIPEAQINGNGKLASWLTIVGFIVMMILDVGLG